MYAFDFAVTVRPKAGGGARAKKIEKSQLTLREKVGFGRFGGASIAAAGENFDEFDPRNAIF